MEDVKYCESCGMPLQKQEDLGTNEDGTLNEMYCCHCFQDGRYTQELTMEEMIQSCLQFLDEFNRGADTNFSKEEALNEMRAYFPKLKRWSGEV